MIKKIIYGTAWNFALHTLLNNEELSEEEAKRRYYAGEPLTIVLFTNNSLTQSAVIEMSYEIGFVIFFYRDSINIQSNYSYVRGDGKFLTKDKYFLAGFSLSEFDSTDNLTKVTNYYICQMKEDSNWLFQENMCIGGFDYITSTPLQSVSEKKIEFNSIVKNEPKFGEWEDLIYKNKPKFIS